MRGLTTIHLASDDALSILDRHTTFALIDDDDADDCCESDNQEDQDKHDIHYALLRILNQICDPTRDTGNDPRENDQADPIANPFFGDELTDPHQASSTSGERENDDDHAHNRGVGHRATVAEVERHPKCLDETKTNGQISRILNNLLAVIFCDRFQTWENNGQKLNDDRRVNIWRDAHRKDGNVFQCAPGDRIKETKELDLFNQCCNLRFINARNWNVTPNAENQEHH